MKRPKKLRPIVIVHEEKGSTIWVSIFTRPMNGEPEVIEFHGFAHEVNALEFKAGRRQSMRDVTSICHTHGRPEGMPAPKGHRPK
jgi:hypothetical protein